ncbi:hypothetical protein [Luteolibacter sp. Populi]|uniref:hypothetical protein n=1 Tax=Luteolibacter sp. Populi TaxID=3230487 RepID=UPI003465A079
MVRSVSRAFAFVLTLACTALAVPNDPFVAIPGTVIAESPVGSGISVASPSIAILPNGNYVALHDTYGAYQMETVFLSTNRGATWAQVAEFPGQWHNLFLDAGQLYAMGTQRSDGSMVIRRSSDGGLTWTNPTNATNGLLKVGNFSTGYCPDGGSQRQAVARL